MREEIALADTETARRFAGVAEARLRDFRRLLRVGATLRGERLVLDGEPATVARAAAAAREALALFADGAEPSAEALGRLLERHRVSGPDPPARTAALIFPGGRRVEPATTGQAVYVEAIRAHDLTFCTGVAGTGKTYLAMAAALEALAREQVTRIVIVRPAVEAGERLGFLPGDLREKVSPYLRPLTDALAEMTSFRQMERYLERGVVEIAPLAYMRGRTLGGVFAVLDEAQNSTPAQLKMFLTRLGPNSKAVVTGDATQTDLPDAARSGLVVARRILDGIPEIAFVELAETDIVRHPLVRAIVDAWARHEARVRAGTENAAGDRP